MKAPNVNMFAAQLLVEEMIRRDITAFCISPGSRSTPLTIAAARHPDAVVQVNIDERASAFYAAGYASATGRAAAVICTSGTAAANMFPAVIEAYQSRLPMVIISADRPEELQNVGANQTIDQDHLFGSYAASSVTIPAPDESTDVAVLLDTFENILKVASATPVHINFRFREPLAPISSPYDHDRMQKQVDQWRRAHKTAESTQPSISDNQTLDNISSLIERTDKGLIVVGPEAPFRACRKIRELSDRLGWPVVADILSQMRFGRSANVAAHYDLYLDNEAVSADLRPEIILHLGGLPTSKRLNQFLLACKGAEYIKLQDHNRTIDPDHLETQRLMGCSDEIVESLLTSMQQRTRTEYFSLWMALENKCEEFLKHHLRANDFTEPALAYQLGRMLPDGQALCLSSSMPVRDADTFISTEGKNIIVGANRGASGIDGIIASACGFAAGSKRSTTLLIGDLAFIHDLNSLTIAKDSPVPLIIVVINNDGGGIFHFLPVADHTNSFEKCFAVPHGRTFEKAAGLFDLPYHHPKTLDEFAECYRKAVECGRTTIIEITGDRNRNKQEHDHIRMELKNHFKNWGK